MKVSAFANNDVAQMSVTLFMTFVIKQGKEDLCAFMITKVSAILMGQTCSYHRSQEAERECLYIYDAPSSPTAPSDSATLAFFSQELSAPLVPGCQPSSSALTQRVETCYNACSSSIPGHQSLRQQQQKMCLLLYHCWNQITNQSSLRKEEIILSQHESTAHPAKEARVEAAKQ